MIQQTERVKIEPIAAGEINSPSAEIHRPKFELKKLEDPFHAVKAPLLKGHEISAPSPKHQTVMEEKERQFAKSSEPEKLRHRIGEKLESSAGAVGDLATVLLAYGAQIALFTSSPVAYAAISGNVLKFALHSLVITPFAIFFANVSLDSAMMSVEKKISKTKQMQNPNQDLSGQIGYVASQALNWSAFGALKVLSVPTLGIGELIANTCVKLGQILKLNRTDPAA